MLTNHFFSPQKRRPSQKMPPRVSPATGLNASWTTRQSRISAHMKVDTNLFYCRCVTNMHRKRRLSLIPKRLPLLKLLSFFIDLAPDTLFSDLVAMEALTNITCTYNEDYTSFCLSFFFAENPFFTNEVSPSPRLQSERILLWCQTKGARCTLFEYRTLSNSEHLTPWTYFFFISGIEENLHRQSRPAGWEIPNTHRSRELRWGREVNRKVSAENYMYKSRQ